MANIIQVAFDQFGKSTVTVNKNIQQGDHLVNQVRITFNYDHDPIGFVRISTKRPDGSVSTNAEVFLLDLLNNYYYYDLPSWFTEYEGQLEISISVMFSQVGGETPTQFQRKFFIYVEPSVIPEGDTSPFDEPSIVEQLEGAIAQNGFNITVLQSEIDDVNDALDLKSNIGHTHVTSDIIDIQDTIGIEVENVLGETIQQKIDETFALSPKADLVDGKVPSTQLPSYVDDVLEYATLAGFPTTGETGKIYVALNTNLTYRWSGSAYVEISASLALGTTSSTAYRGDYGNTAYAHSQITNGTNPHNTKFSYIAFVGTVAENASTVAKTTTISGFSALESGQIFIITFTNGNTASYPTLNIGSTGAKQLQIGGIHITSAYATLASGTTLLLLYNGTAFQMMGSQRTQDNDTTYSTITQGEITAGTETATRVVTPKLLVDNFSKIGHTHDDRYYTETEITTLLSNYQQINDDLTAYIGLGTVGLVKKTGAGTAVIITDSSSNWNNAYNHSTTTGNPHGTTAGDITSGTLGVAYGGTGANTFTSNNVLIGNGTSAITTKAITDSTTATAFVSSDTNLITNRSIYYGTPTINGAKLYNSSTTIYAPTSVGTSGQLLTSSGSGTVPPSWSNAYAVGSLQRLFTLQTSFTLYTRAFSGSTSFSKTFLIVAGTASAKTLVITLTGGGITANNSFTIYNGGFITVTLTSGTSAWTSAVMNAFSFASSTTFPSASTNLSTTATGTFTSATINLTVASTGGAVSAYEILL